jgi:glutaredoxin
MFPFKSVSMYSKDDCPWCDKARDLLNSKGIVIEREHKVGRDVTPAQFKLIAGDHGWTPPTVPLIFGKKEDASWTIIGGYTQLSGVFDNENDVSRND